MSDFVDVAVCGDPSTKGIALKIAAHQHSTDTRRDELTFKYSRTIFDESSSIKAVGNMRY